MGDRLTKKTEGRKSRDTVPLTNADSLDLFLAFFLLHCLLLLPCTILREAAMPANYWPSDDFGEEKKTMANER
jgi:hypothetical protein